MAKVSFRMASASRESVFGVQTSTARKNHRSGRRGPVDHDAKQMLRTERNRCRHTVAWSPSREHRPRAVCRKTGSVTCAGQGTNRDRATPMCRRRREPPGRTQALLPGTDCPTRRNPPDHHVVHRHDLMQSRGADGTEAQVNSLAQPWQEQSRRRCTGVLQSISWQRSRARGCSISPMATAGLRRVSCGVRSLPIQDDVVAEHGLAAAT